MEPLRDPYPPDLDPEAEQPDSLDDALDARFEHGEFANVRAIRSSLRRVELHLCRLTGAELAEATWLDVRATDCRFDLAGFRYAKLERVVFSDCILEEADFSAAKLTDVLFERCKLRLAAFSGATTDRIRFVGCDLEGLEGVEALRGAGMRWDDVVQNAPLFARALGIEIVEDE